MQQREWSTQLDWVRFSLPDGTAPDAIMPDLPPFRATGEMFKPLPAYTKSYGMICGRVDWNEERPGQRVLVTFTGLDLKRMRNKFDYTDEQLIGHVERLPGVKWTRLDLSLDTADTRISPAEAKHDFTAGRLTTRARSISEIVKTGKDGTYQGHTVYVGSRTSEQFLRVYDKAKESDLPGHLTRVELELKGWKAREAAAAVVKHSASGATIAAFRRFFEWKNAGWMDIISGESVQVGRLVEDKQDQREKWLMSVALPAIINEIKSGNKNIADKLFGALNISLREIDLSQY